MMLNTLKEQTFKTENSSTRRRYQQLRHLLNEVEKKRLPDHVIASVNTMIEKLNDLTEDQLNQGLKKAGKGILKLLEKECRLVPRHHYRNIWMAVGMSVFGLPLGFAFGSAIGNRGLLSIGLPIGMAIGLAIGTGMDKKALAENRQLDVDPMY